MKIAWFTPFSKKSAIGKYSQIATNELAKDCKIDLWLFEKKNLLHTVLRIVYYKSDEDLARRLSNYDLLVYNLGDYVPYHRDIYEVSKRIKGIIILHDFVMHNFFYGYYMDYRNRSDLYKHYLGKLYGKTGIKMAEDTLSGKTGGDRFVHFPFFEKAISGALGVITHSHFLTAKVEEKFTGHVETIYFPYRQKLNFIKVKPSKSVIKIQKNKVLLLTIGNVNPNKRVHKVIDVIGKNKAIKEKVQYVIIGSDAHSSYISKIQKIIDKHGLKEIVKVLGYQEDEVLDYYLWRADIVINLRQPVMEGASWSLLDQMFCGKAIVVNDMGFYSEFPDDCLFKVKSKNEEQNIKFALKKLINNEKLRKNMASKAKQIASENFTPDKYRKGFMDFVYKLICHKPVYDLIDKVSSELQLLGVEKDNKVIEKVTEEIYRMNHYSPR